MQLILVAALVLLSGGYLLKQYLSGAFAARQTPVEQVDAAETAAARALKAA